MKIRFGVVCLLWLMVPAENVFSKEDTIIDEIVISANKIEEPLSGVFQTLDVINQKNFKDQATQTVVEALKDVSGVIISERGLKGDDVDIRIRGSDRDEVLILLDGMPIHDNADAKVDVLSLIPVDHIERIEILKGSQSILYGTDAVGGVINIITKKPKPGQDFLFKWQVGNLTSFKETVSAQGGSENTQALIAVTRDDSNGFNMHSNFDSTAVSSRLSHQADSDFKIDLSLHYIRANQDLNKEQINSGGNIYIVDDTNASDHDEFFNIVGKVNNKWTDVYESQLLWGFNYTREKYLNSNNEAGVNDVNGAPLFRGSSYYRSHSYRNDLDFLNHFRFIDDEDLKYRLSVGYNFTLDHLDFISNSFPGDVGAGLPFTSGYPGAGQSANRKNHAVYFENVVNFKNLTLTAGMRFDKNSTYGKEISPRASVGYLINPTDTKIHFTYSEGFHAPQIADFFTAIVGTSLVALPIKLEPDLTQMYEAGIEQKLFDKKVKLRSTYFYIDYDSLLDIAEATNDAYSWGIESDVIINPYDWISFGGNYTFNKTKNEDDNLPLTLRPKHSFNTFVSVEPVKGLTVRADANYVSSKLNPRFVSLTIFELPVQFFNSSNNTSTQVAGHFLLDLSARYQIPKKPKWINKWEVFGKVVNLLDDQYEEMYGYPQPGIQIYGGSEINF